jgi:LysM repeat protein
MTGMTRRALLLATLLLVMGAATGCVRAKPARTPVPVARLLGTATPTASGEVVVLQATAIATVSESTAAVTAEPTAIPPAEPVEPAAPAELAPGEILHTVAPGDTTYSIAERYYSTVSTILRRNALPNADAIVVGQQLVVPVGAAAGPDVTPFSTTAAPVAQPEAPVVQPVAPIAQPVAPAPSATPDVVRHTVRRGETLAHLSRTYRTTVGEIRALNPVIVNPDHVPAGTVLTIRPNTAPPVQTHQVQRGETVASISRRYGVSMQALVQANGLRDPNHVYVGQVLIIPR